MIPPFQVLRPQALGSFFNPSANPDDFALKMYLPTSHCLTSYHPSRPSSSLTDSLLIHGPPRLPPLSLIHLFSRRQLVSVRSCHVCAQNHAFRVNIKVFTVVREALHDLVPLRSHLLYSPTIWPPCCRMHMPGCSDSGSLLLLFTALGVLFPDTHLPTFPPP